MAGEREIPSESESTRDLVRVEVPAKGVFPDGYREGRKLEGFLETVHVRGEAGLTQASADTINVIRLDVWT